MEINGVAHIFITAGDFAAARAFYGALLPFLGLTPVMDNAQVYYCVGGRTGFGIEAPPPRTRASGSSRGRVGLHHVCFRARARDDVRKRTPSWSGSGPKIVHGPQEDRYAPGYYSILFEDPDGVRLEINHVPGRGLLAEDGPHQVGQALGPGV